MFFLSKGLGGLMTGGWVDGWLVACDGGCVEGWVVCVVPVGGCTVEGCTVGWTVVVG